MLAKLDNYMQENETGLLSNPMHKSKLEMDQRPECNVSHETIKLLEDNIGKNLLNINMSNFFLNESPQARETEAKMNTWDYIKLTSFCIAKDSISRTKRHPTVWENTFVNDISDKGLTSKIYKEITCLNTQTANNLIKKWAEDMK